MAYTTHAQVRYFSGQEPTYVVGESLGTGDNSETTFYTEYYPLADVNGSESITITDVTVYVDGSPVTVSSVNGNSGQIILASAPGTDTAITVDYAYSSVSEEAFALAIASADDFVEEETGQVFSNANAKTDYFDGDSLKKVFILEKYPVQSITAVSLREAGGTGWDTQTEADGDGVDDDYWPYITDNQSWIEFVEAPETGNRNVKIEYTYGYSSIPTLASELSACFAAIWILLLLDSGWGIEEFRLVEQQVRFAKGTAHAQHIERLQAHIDRLLSRVGRKIMIGII